MIANETTLNKRPNYIKKIQLKVTVSPSTMSLVCNNRSINDKCKTIKKQMFYVQNLVFKFVILRNVIKLVPKVQINHLFDFNNKNLERKFNQRTRNHEDGVQLSRQSDLRRQLFTPSNHSTIVDIPVLLEVSKKQTIQGIIDQ